ncbi:MAG: Eco57I restriction-modification methylase domain-containing protein [Candidatus Dojkabacteria bacterium]|nr:Eco57I restriction-modification methylase domain-containing protein [Candidatus Dojkabacteria bacterium]
MDDNESTYYRAILQNLFFATLNTPISERKFRKEESFHGVNEHYMNHTYFRFHDYFKNPDDMLNLFGNIPFLNGGLFECLDKRADDPDNYTGKEIRIDGFSDVKSKQVTFPNILFFSDEVTVGLDEFFPDSKDKKRYNGVKIRGLINILSSYKFTIDENTLNDEEVALDPELLGNIFENLLAAYNPETAATARKATGSYYTPRVIVDYMVTESLKEYLTTQFSQHYGIDQMEDFKEKLETLFSSEHEENPFDEGITDFLIQKINKIKIIDPAVGSGAFPMGMLHKLVFLLSKLDPHNERWKREQIAIVEKITDPKLRQKIIQKIEENFQHNELDYGRKLYLIQNCLYGVDIQPIAIQIAKLRFFISLLVDEKSNNNKDENFGIEPLPNLETKLVAANTLVALPQEPYQCLKMDEIIRLEKDLFEVRNSYFTANTQKEKSKIQKEDREIRNKLKKLIEDYVSDNKNELNKLQNELEQLPVRLEYVEERTLLETKKVKKDVNEEKRNALMNKIRDLENKIKADEILLERYRKVAEYNIFNPHISEVWFDPEWMFGVEVGDDKIVNKDKDVFAYHITWSTHNSRRKEDYEPSNTEGYAPVLLSCEERKYVTKILAQRIVNKRYRVLALNVLDDHVHLLLVCGENEITKIVGDLKGFSSYAMSHLNADEVQNREMNYGIKMTQGLTLKSLSKSERKQDFVTLTRGVTSESIHATPKSLNVIPESICNSKSGEYIGTVTEGLTSESIHATPKSLNIIPESICNSKSGECIGTVTEGLTPQSTSQSSQSTSQSPQSTSQSPQSTSQSPQSTNQSPQSINQPLQSINQSPYSTNQPSQSLDPTPQSSDLNPHSNRISINHSFEAEDMYCSSMPAYNDGTISKLWARKFGKALIRSEKHIVNAIEYIQNNHLKHNLPEVDPALYEYALTSFDDAFKNFVVSKGFDIVIGNPPYVQLQKAYDSRNKYADLYKNQNFETFDRTGDLYCLFYEKGIQLLRQSGLLCYITSNKWMRAGYGEKLRNFFTQYNPRILIDLGPNVFENATVDTNILIIRKEQNKNELKAVTISESKKDGIDFADILQKQGVTVTKLKQDAWFIGSDAEQSLKEKIERIGKPLKDWDVKIYRGILTGLNEAFIIDSKKREEILANCRDEDERRRTEAIIKPILRGRDIKRYYYEWAGLWVIIAKFGFYKEAHLYPAIINHLSKYETQLKQRGQCQYTRQGAKLKNPDFLGQHHWLELDNNPQDSYLTEFEKEKVVGQRITQEPTFCLVEPNILILDSMAFFTGENLMYIMAILNSKLIYNYVEMIVHQYGYTGFRLSNQYVEMMPLPPHHSIQSVHSKSD